MSRLDLAAYEAGVRAGDRTVLARAITLVESRRPEDRELGAQLLARFSSSVGSAHRVGITGVPGVGKSTFIEALGTQLTGAGHRVAVVAVDPSSARSGGSILGDKTRMAKLALDPNAFVRPSPSGGSLGGVARRTRETMTLCEAAGYDVILVETVGVGQSEVAVSQMVDFFLVLVLGGGGDELQGIKRGIMELADGLVVNKADGDNVAAANRAKREYAMALHLLRPATRGWTPRTLTCSSLTGEGIGDVWTMVNDHRAALTESGEWEPRRRNQRVAWMWGAVRDGLDDALRQHPDVQSRLTEVERRVLDGSLSAEQGAHELLAAFGVASPDDSDRE